MKRGWREQAHQEKRLVFVGFKDRRRGTILLHGLQHLWDAGAAAQREAQFFEKLADAAVRVAACDCIDLRIVADPAIKYLFVTSSETSSAEQWKGMRKHVRVVI